MDYPRASPLDILEQPQLTAIHLLVLPFSSLILNILSDYFHCHLLSHRINIVSTCPNVFPNSIVFTSGCRRYNSLAVIVFTIRQRTISDGLILGILCIKKCMWSLSQPISMNSISYFIVILKRLIITSYLLPLKIFWDNTLQNKLSKYNNTLTLWDFYIASAIYQNSEIFLRRRDKPTGIL